MTQGLRLVLFGPPGAGKGTQALLLAEQLELGHISSGDLFRRHLQAGTPLGLRAAEYMNRGDLVPDEVTIDIVLEKVMSFANDEGFILDGFPRNDNQAQVLEDALNRRARGVDHVVYIDVPEEELIQRLAGRYNCRDCQATQSVPSGSSPGDVKCERCGGELYQRADDAPEAVRQRILVYQRETLPALEFYRKRNLLREISGAGTIEGVNQRVLQALGREAVLG
ncbi:MAG: adenylate kinase [Chloroflexi bacterium]|nr:adenylate kinase [Chloroflexota bacterium]